MSSWLANDEYSLLILNEIPFSRNIVQKLICFELTDEHVPANGSTTVNLGKSTVRIHRVSYVGELGYELHIAKGDCSQIYNKIMTIGTEFGLENAGFRAFYSLGFEKGNFCRKYRSTLSIMLVCIPS